MEKVEVKLQNKWIILWIVFLIMVLLAAAYLAKQRAKGNYSNPVGPFFEGSYAGELNNFDGSLRVVTWNMHYADQVEQAIETLEDVDELRDAEILLLQEIDAAGVETIAKRLRYNYVFYPAAFNPQRQKLFGNAILAKWPLQNPTKIVLPNFIPGWLESRNSANATITIGGRDISVYSAHLDLTWMFLMRHESQGEFLAGEAEEKGHMIIMGGDFNTWTPGSVRSFDQRLDQVGLERLTQGTGYTFRWAGVKLTLDHIFSNTQIPYEAGVYRRTDASDHFPVWAEIVIAGDE